MRHGTEHELPAARLGDTASPSLTDEENGCLTNILRVA